MAADISRAVESLWLKCEVDKKSIAIKFAFIWEPIQLYLVRLCKLNLCRFIVEQKSPRRFSIKSPFKVWQLIWITNIFKIKIHTCDQSCTWRELTKYKTFHLLLQLLWGQETRYLNLITLDIVVFVKPNVCPCETADSSCSRQQFKYDVDDWWLSFCDQFSQGK